VLAVIQVGSVAALRNTNYGIILVGKLALVAVLFALAAFNRFKLTPRIAANDDAARAFLRRSIAAECLVALAIFALVAGWRFTPPPRATALAQAPAAIHVHGGRAVAQIELSPQAPLRATLRLTDLARNPLAAKEVTLSLANPAAGIEPIRRAAASLGDGRWQVDGLRIPVGGAWRIAVEILVSDFDKITLEQTADLPRMP
jgi:copper transport protein